MEKSLFSWHKALYIGKNRSNMKMHWFREFNSCRRMFYLEIYFVIITLLLYSEFSKQHNHDANLQRCEFSDCACAHPAQLSILVAKVRKQHLDPESSEHACGLQITNSIPYSRRSSQRVLYYVHATPFFACIFQALEVPKTTYVTISGQFPTYVRCCYKQNGTAERSLDIPILYASLCLYGIVCGRSIKALRSSKTSIASAEYKRTWRPCVHLFNIKLITIAVQDLHTGFRNASTCHVYMWKKCGAASLFSESLCGMIVIMIQVEPCRKWERSVCLVACPCHPHSCLMSRLVVLSQYMS